MQIFSWVVFLLLCMIYYEFELAFKYFERMIRRIVDVFIHQNILIYAYYFIYNVHMRTTLNLPLDLLDEAEKLSGSRTKTRAIIVALEEYIRRKKVKRLIGAAGTLKLENAWEKSRHGR